MQIPHDKQFVYRFDPSSGSVYGPRTLEWVVNCYLTNEKCECAPFFEKDGDGPVEWKPVRIWFGQMLPAPMTARQGERLRRLNVVFDQTLKTKAEAQQAIRQAEAVLPPTNGQLLKVKRLKISIPTNATREIVSGLIREHQDAIELALERKEAKQLASSLRRKGIVAKDEMSVGELDDLESAWLDLDEALKGAKKIGLKVDDYPNDCPQKMMEYASALFELVYQFECVQADLDGLLEYGLLPKKPSKPQIKAALPYLFGRILDKTWRGEESDMKSFYEVALAEQVGPSPAKVTRTSSLNPPPLPKSNSAKSLGVFDSLKQFLGI